MNWLALAPITGAVIVFVWIVFFSYRPGILEEAERKAWDIMRDHLEAEGLELDNYRLALSDTLDSYDYLDLFWKWKAMTAEELYPDLISRLELALLYDNYTTKR